MKILTYLKSVLRPESNQCPIKCNKSRNSPLRPRVHSATNSILNKELIQNKNVVDTVIVPFLNTFIYSELEKSYKKALNGMDIKMRPWSMYQCLEYLSRFWMTVFCSTIKRQGREIVQQLQCLNSLFEKCECFLILFLAL